MLKVPVLDDLSYEKLFERARSRIPNYTEDWTDFNAHDPGITTLQMLAWLTDTLNYYIDATGEEHRLKYLSLLGLKPERRAARALVAIQSPKEVINIPKGAKLAAGTTIFETVEDCSGAANRLSCLHAANGGAVYFGFERPLEGDVRFYVNAAQHPRRGAFDDDFRLVAHEWEYNDGKGWQPASLVEDGACGFLKAGFVSLRLNGRTANAKPNKKLQKAHYLRARPVSGEYDAPLRIDSVYTNCVEVIQTDTLAEEITLGVTTGFANEKLYVDMENLYELELSVAGKSWTECESLTGAGPDDRVFELDRSTGWITFGDGYCGALPGAGQTVTAVTVKTSLLDAGNVRAGSIDRFLDWDAAVTNPQDAKGGARPKSSAELEREIESVVTKTTRAVTAEDYKELAAATPGLMIDEVNVISGENPNTVLLAVKPYSPKDPRPSLSETYRERIRQNLERYRLLTTDIRVLPPKYVRVEADGRIVLTENTPAYRLLVENAIKEHTGGAFGRSLVYGRIFSRLEMLSCVAKVSDLSLTCAGEGAHKNEQGDIVIYPDAIACLDKINIEFV